MIKVRPLFLIWLISREILLPLYLTILLIQKMNFEVKKRRYKKVIIGKLMWFFYVLGLFSVTNIIFWLYQYIAHTVAVARGNEKPNLINGNPQFHKRTFYYGIVVSSFQLLFWSGIIIAVFLF